MHHHPTWLSAHEWPTSISDPLHVSWLNERGSLTARLRQTWGEVSVDVIEEGLAPLEPAEAERLALPHGEVAWVRRVWLRCHGQARVYARTVIPQWGPLNPWLEVQRLGRQPLGELLFHATGLERSAFEWCADAHWPSPSTAPAGVRALARRCLFRRESAPLLLTEAFLDLRG